MATAIIFDNPQAMRSKRWALTQKPKPKRIQGTELRPLCQWLAASGAIQSCGREHHATRGVSGHRDTEKRAAPNRTPQGERQGRGPTTQRGHPRSLSYEFDQFLSRKIPNYELRHLIRPGLSGWAQVNYTYGASIEDSANKLSYDLYYLKNFSCLLDLLILFKTIRLVFNAQGALPEPSIASNPFFLTSD